jgi:hypothetical protein
MMAADSRPLDWHRHWQGERGKRKEGQGRRETKEKPMPAFGDELDGVIRPFPPSLLHPSTPGQPHRRKRRKEEGLEEGKRLQRNDSKRNGVFRIRIPPMACVLCVNEL